MVRELARARENVLHQRIKHLSVLSLSCLSQQEQLQVQPLPQPQKEKERPPSNSID